MVSIIMSKMTVARTRSPCTRGRYGCRWRQSRTARLVSSLHIRLHRTGSSTTMRKVNSANSPYWLTRAERYACCSRYEVSERKLAKGDSSVRFSGMCVTRLYAKSLFALAKSYVESKIAASWEGLFHNVSLSNLNQANVWQQTMLRTLLWPLPPTALSGGPFEELEPVTQRR